MEINQKQRVIRHERQGVYSILGFSDTFLYLKNSWFEEKRAGKCSTSDRVALWQEVTGRCWQASDTTSNTQFLLESIASTAHRFHFISGDGFRADYTNNMPKWGKKKVFQKKKKLLRVPQSQEDPNRCDAFSSHHLCDWLRDEKEYLMFLLKCKKKAFTTRSKSSRTKHEKLTDNINVHKIYTASGEKTAKVNRHRVQEEDMSK